MKNNTTTTNAPMNENYAELRKKALEYGIYDPSFEYKELREAVMNFENKILRVTGSLFNGEVLSDEEVKALNVDQEKAKRIIKTLGDSLSYAIQLYADTVNNPDLINQIPLTLGYDILKEIKDCYYDKLSWKTRPKRTVWECLQVNINNIDHNNTFDSSLAVNIKEFSNKKEAAASGKPVLVPITETRAKKVAMENDRELLVVKMVPSDGPFADVILSNAMSYIHDANQLEALMEEKRREIITNGITDVATGKHYLVAVRSAAQSRNGSMWFYEAHDFTEVDEFRRRCCCLTKTQWEKEFGNEVYMSKMEARIGLSVSSVLDIREVTKACREENFVKTIENFKVKLIPDVKNEIVLNTVQPIFNPKGEFEGCMTNPTPTKITNNASDGCGMISVEATIQCNYALNLISDKEYRRAMSLFEEYGRSLTAFKSLEPADPTSKEAKDYYWFESFILKLHKVLQFRHAGDKGILVMADFDHYGITEDILIHESVRKYDFGEWADAPLEICNYDKKKTGKANMNFQFWNALTISNEDMKSIVDESLDYINHGVLEKPEMAMKFLGMLSKIGEDEEDIDTVIKLNTALKTDPNMLDDKQMQKWLAEKVKKFLNDLQIGRIPIDGAYYFIVTDPRYLIAKYLKRDDIDFLQSKQNYLNGYVGDIAAFRAPLIDKSEARKLPCIADDGLWFYTDLLIFNPFDGTASAAGGADFDGDKMLATADKRIVDNVKDYGYIIYDKGISSDKVMNNWKNRIDFFVKTSTPDKTGYITNLATKWTDLSHNYRLIGDDRHEKMYQACTIALRFLQGWEIDSAKTGKNAEAIGFPKQLKAAKTPHHFIGMRDIQGRTVNVKQEDIYVSRAALGFLFDYVQDYRKNHLLEDKKSNPKLHYLGKLLSAEEMEASGMILPYIKNIEKDYRREVAVVANLKDSIDKKTFMDFLAEIYTKYNGLLMSLVNKEDGITEKVVVYTAYYATYVRGNHESNSTSFPWNCMFDSMIMLLSENNTSVRMYRVPFDEIEEMKIENSHLFVNEKDLGAVPCNVDMDLAVTVIDNKPFAIVPVTVKKEAKPKKLPDTKSYQISVTGFRHNVSGNCENFIEMVKNNKCLMDFVYENNMVIVKINGQQIAALSSDYVVNDILNTTVMLKSHGATTYIPKRISKSTVMKNETEAYSGTITLEVIVYNHIGEVVEGFGQAIQTQTATNAYSNDYSVNDYDYASDYYCAEADDYVVSAAECSAYDSMYEDLAKDTIGADIDFDFEDMIQ